MLAFLAKYFGPRALKAVMGGIGGTALAAAFTEGFSSGLIPVAHDLGAQIGVGLGAFIINYILVYIFPNRKD